MPFTMPNLMQDNQRYVSQVKSYQDELERQREIESLRVGFGHLTDDVDNPLDPIYRAIYGKEYGLDVLGAALNNGVKPTTPAWETKFDNGVLVRYDKNNPTNAEVVKGPDGNPITEKADGDVRKTAGWFRRAVPALENMHKLEDRGVALPREALLLTQQAQDADGFFDMQIYNKLLNDLSLTQDQKQYLRNAQDLAMIQLRKESGAAIGVQEMFNELNQNVMLTDMSDEGYEYQRVARGNKYRQLASEMTQPLIDAFTEEGLFETMDRLRRNSARVRPDAGGKRASLDPVGDFYNFSDTSDAAFDLVYKDLPEGTRFIGPDGKAYIKGSE